MTLDAARAHEQNNPCLPQREVVREKRVWSRLLTRDSDSESGDNDGDAVNSYH